MILSIFTTFTIIISTVEPLLINEIFATNNIEKSLGNLSNIIDFLTNDALLTDDQILLTYQNSSLGFNVRYPSVLKKDIIDHIDLTDKLVFTLPSDSKSQPYKNPVVIEIGVADRPNVTLVEELIGNIEGLTEYKYIDINSLNDSIDNNVKDTLINVINANFNATLAGFQAYHLMWMFKSSDGLIYKALEIGTIFNNKLFYLQYFAEPSLYFNHYSDTFKEIVNSFKILNSPSYDYFYKGEIPTFTDVVLNDSNLMYYHTTGQQYQIDVPKNVTNVFLNGTVINSNNNPISNFTLIDISKCKDLDEEGFIINLESCSEFLLNKKNLKSGSTIEVPLSSGKQYEINIDDYPNATNYLNVNFLLTYQRSLLEYVDYNTIGIRTLYPYNWEISKEEKGVRFFSPLSNDSDHYQENIFIHTTILPNNITLDEMIKTDLHNYEIMNKDFKLLDINTNLSINGQKADSIVFTFTKDQYSFKVMQIYTLYNDKFYRITYTSLFDNYFEFVDIPTMLVQSLKFVKLIQSKGIFISYPSDWVIDREGENKSVLRFSPLENHTNTQIITLKFPSKNLALEDFVSSRIKDYEKFQKFDLLNFVKLNNTNNNKFANSYLIEFKYKELNHTSFDIFTYKLEVYTQLGNDVYATIYSDYLEMQTNYLSYLFTLYLTAYLDIISSFHIPLKNNFTLVNSPVLKMQNLPIVSAIDSNTNKLYISNSGSNTITAIDLLNNDIKNITVENKPSGITINSATKSLYVTNTGSDSVSVIDPITNNVTSTIKVRDSPVGIVSDSTPSDNLVFVSNLGNKSISVIFADINKHIEAIALNNNPENIAINPFTNRLYISDSFSNNLTVIDYFRVDKFNFNYSIYNIIIEKNLRGIAINPLTNKIYVASSGSDAISVIDGYTNKWIGFIPVSAEPEYLDLNPQNNMLLVTHPNYNNISIIDANKDKVIKTINIKNIPEHVKIHSETNIGYISDSASNGIFIVNGNTKNVSVGIKFKINNPNYGYITCNNTNNNNINYHNFSDNSYAIYDYGTLLYCNAIENNGYKFLSWSGYSNPSKNNSTIRLNLTTFDTLVANFDKISINPWEEIFEKNKDIFWALITSAILGPIIGWIIPFMISQREKQRQLSYLKVYLPSIDRTYFEYRQNKEECQQLLEQKRIEITALLNEGLLNDTTFRILNDRILQYEYNLTYSK